MKVLHITPFYEPAWKYGGPPRSISDLCQSLNLLGIRTDVLTTNANCNTFLEVPCNKFITVNLVNVFYSQAIILRPIYSKAFYKACYELIPNYDLIHFTGVWQILMQRAMKLCRDFKRPYIISPRGALSRWSFNYKKRRKAFFLELLVKKKYTRLFCPSFCLSQ